MLPSAHKDHSVETSMEITSKCDPYKSAMYRYIIAVGKPLLNAGISNVSVLRMQGTNFDIKKMNKLGLKRNDMDRSIMGTQKYLLDHTDTDSMFYCSYPELRIYGTYPTL